MRAADAISAGRAGAAGDAGETRDDASHLPALGRKGGGWVAIQGALLVAAVAAGLAGMAWPHAASPWLAAAGILSALAGAGLMVGGGAGLGKQLTPFPRPIDDGTLRRDGVYGLVRHPMYGGALLLVLGWALLSSPLALVPLALAAAFLDAKRRREEAWLEAKHPDYADYRRGVSRQFIPFVW
jgi:protein-S-isoprenylcysteine O-methyltransferase Ste14